MMEERRVDGLSNVLADCLVRLTGYRVKKKCPGLLRLVVVWDERNQTHTNFITN